MKKKIRKKKPRKFPKVDWRKALAASKAMEEKKDALRVVALIEELYSIVKKYK